MIEIKYRDYKMVQYTFGDGTWCIFNILGQQAGEGATFWAAKQYIDLKYAAGWR